MRHIYTFVLLLFLLGIPTLYFTRESHSHRDLVDHDDLATIRRPAEEGGAIMGRLGDPEIKAELGRSTWKLLHTMTARYPEHPSQDERQALSQFIYLLSRLYPCGECAAEFQQLLKKYPPQTSSRESASQWACAVHNLVNTRLRKLQFDCSIIAEKYKCGCNNEPSPQSAQDKIVEARAEEAKAKAEAVEQRMAEVELDIDG